MKIKKKLGRQGKARADHFVTNRNYKKHVCLLQGKKGPVFHWTDGRILGHFVMCFMVYFCEAYLREVLRRRRRSYFPTLTLVESF